MNRALPILSLCLALVALAFAAAPREPLILPPAPVEAARATDADPELRRRIDQLEDDNRALWDRVVVLERQRQLTVLTDAGVVAPSVAAEVAQLREEVRGMISGEVLSNDASRAALKEVIRETQADTQRERQVQREQRQEQRATEQKAKWKAFATEAKLTWAQEQELTRRLETEETARRAFFLQAQQGGAPDNEGFRALRDQRRETDQVMNGLLDDTQKQQYLALRREDRGGGGRADRPGGETAK